MKYNFKNEIAKMSVWILGMRRSGLAAARLLHHYGAEVFVTEKDPADRVAQEVQQLNDLGIASETDGHRYQNRPLPDFAVISPGIPLNVPIIDFLKEQQVPVYSEIELASWFYHGVIIAVTGSNGKTTITHWIAHLLKTAGLDALAAGNIGYPFSELVLHHPETQYAVVEVSSFQLETIDSFHPKIAILTNLSPDHLDRHGDLLNYGRVKKRISNNQEAQDFLLLPETDPSILRLVENVKAAKFFINTESIPENGAGFKDGELFFIFEGNEEKILQRVEIPLPGRHNLENALFSSLAVRLLSLPTARIREGLRTFPGVAHRLQTILNNGRIFINDSKSTNVESLKVALEAVAAPIWLILGGRDKGTPFDPVKQLVAVKVERILLIGEAAERIEKELAGLAPIIHCGTLERAVRLAAEEAPIGRTILLSPACASFDQFENYEHRGVVFQALVEEATK